MPNNPLYRYLFITYLFIRGIYPLILAEYVFLESFGMNALFSHTRIYRLCLFSATKRLFTGFDLLALPDHLKEEFDIAENEKYLKPLLQRSSAQLKVSPKWNQSVGWKCTHCRGKWWASPSNRMKRHSEFQCPYCREIKPTMKGLQQLTSSSNVFENDTSNSLLRNRFPAIAKQWDHLRNGNHLNKIAVDLRSANSLSCADAWWKCPQCRKSWKESIRSRVLSFEMYSAESTNDYLSLLCPRCLESCGHHVLSGNSGFLSDHKQLLNEANLRPNQKADAISLYSDTLLNWTCSYCSHEYQNSVANRYLRNECCPQCSGRVKTYLNLLVCQRPDVVKEISHNISHAFLQKISVMDDRKLPFICRVCHAVYYMKVRTRCMIPKGQLACPKCFFRSSLSESCIAVETSPQSRRQVKRRLQGHRIRTQKAAEQGRCVESISLAQHILEQKDRSLRKKKEGKIESNTKTPSRMSDTLRPIHLALFFCERAISKHHSVYRTDHDDLVLWCMHRTAFFYYLCEGEEYLSAAESCENSFTDKETSSEIRPRSTILNTTDDGDRLLIEFLSRCWEIGGNSLYRIFLEYFLDFFQLIYDTDNQTISVHMISDTFMLQGVDLEMIQNADNCFARFQMWISHSWKTMSFDGQMRLAAAVQSWFHHIRYLSEVLIDAPVLQGEVLSPTKLKKCINIRDLHVSLQNVFEGRSHNSNLFARFMFAGQGSFQGDNYATANVVNYFNENVLQSLRTEMSNGPQSVMNNIACGMLLYEKKYLQLRSLENALICAEGSVLIEHQFYSTTIIALSHLSCFEVHFSSCNATKAADCLAMGLQLIKQRRDSIEGYTISLFYLCAAQLLVISPGAAGSSLRSLLYSTHVTSDYLHNNSPGVIKKDATTIQSIPQTVLHALLESESDSICHPSPGSLWKDVLLSVMRNTVLVMGSLSGIVASPMSLTSASIQSLVDEVIHTSPFSVIHRSTESSLLIPELTRNTAHVVLAAQEGTLAVRKKPLEIIADYLIGIREVFGTGTLENVENDFFLRSVARYSLGCWFAKYGYISAAYDLLDELVTEIYFSARIDLYTSTSRVVHPASVNVDQAALLYVKSNSKMYSWSSDQLLCYAYVQMKRAELATFLGYTHYLPFQAEMLKHVSSSSQFAFGVLASQFIEVLHSQHTRHYNLAIEQACALHLSAEKIGYIFLAKRAMAQCVSALSKVGNHQKALFCLDTLRPISRFMHIWHTIARLNCCAELILNFDSADRFLSSSFLLNLVSNIDCKFLFGSAMQVLDNLGCQEARFTTLQDAICLQASVQRILNNMVADDKISVPPLCLEELLNVLHKRQYLRGSFSTSPHLLDSILEAVSGCCVSSY